MSWEDRICDFPCFECEPSYIECDFCGSVYDTDDEFWSLEHLHENE